MTTLVAAELDLENLLLRLPHVLAVRVQMNARGTVRRIHVLANRKARQESLALAVEQALEEQRSLKLDAEVVTVVTLGERPRSAARTGPARPGDPARLELRRLSFERADELRVKATVELKLDDVVFTGELWDADVSSARPVLAATAVLKALDFLRDRGAAFHLELVDFLDGFHAPVALVVVQVRSRREKRVLSGCALVTESPAEASARACLAAINRFSGALLWTGVP